MARRFTLYIIPDDTAPPKRLRVSTRFLAFAFLLLTAFSAATGWLAWQYADLLSVRETAKTLAATVDSQDKEILAQREQIQFFARKMNDYRENLQSLQEFEDKIRVMTDLEKTGENETVLGVGGSLPPELLTEMPLSLEHRGLVREMHEAASDLTAVAESQQQSFAGLLQGLTEKRDLLACTPSLCPVKGWISSRFGYRPSPFSTGREFHKGLDIAAPKGTHVVAPARGRVTFTGWKGGLGRVVIVDHGYGVVTRYGHLKRALVKKGDFVERGAVLGEVGNTGRSTGSHLHYEVHLHGIPVNPEKYIPN